MTFYQIVTCDLCNPETNPNQRRCYPEDPGWFEGSFQQASRIGWERRWSYGKGYQDLCPGCKEFVEANQHRFNHLKKT